MKHNFRALSVALIACALNAFVFGVLKVDDTVLSEKYLRKELVDPRFMSSKKMLSRGNFYDSWHSEPVPVVSQINGSRVMAKEPFRVRASDKIISNQGLSETTEGLLLFNYLNQFNPGDRNQLETIFQVVSDAKDQLYAEQKAASEELESLRSRIDALVDESNGMAYNHQTAGSQGLQVVYAYFDALDAQHKLKKKLALQQEKIEALKSQVDSAASSQASIFLEKEKESLQASHEELSYLAGDIKVLESQVARALQHAPRNLSREVAGLLQRYVNTLDASTDQDVIVEKFENILAAAQYVDFSEI
jgi:hypothetical protein